MSRSHPPQPKSLQSIYKGIDATTGPTWRKQIATVAIGGLVLGWTYYMFWKDNPKHFKTIREVRDASEAAVFGEEVQKQQQRQRERAQNYLRQQYHRYHHNQDTSF